jgi:hypothetical protein
MVFEELVFLHGLHVRDLSVSGYSLGWLAVDILGVDAWDILESLPLDLVRRYLALKDAERLAQERSA